MNIKIDEEKCTGCANCEEICPAVFHVNETIGLSQVIDLDACEFSGCCEAAEENCPEEAIIIEE